MLRSRLACLPDRGERVLLVPGPAVGTCCLDVEVGPSLSGEGGWRLPLACELDRTGYVADLNRKGEFVDADAVRTECCAVISAVWHLVCDRLGFGIRSAASSGIPARAARTAVRLNRAPRIASDGTLLAEGTGAVTLSIMRRPLRAGCLERDSSARTYHLQLRARKSWARAGLLPLFRGVEQQVAALAPAGRDLADSEHGERGPGRVERSTLSARQASKLPSRNRRLATSPVWKPTFIPSSPARRRACPILVWLISTPVAFPPGGSRSAIASTWEPRPHPTSSAWCARSSPVVQQRRSGGHQTRHRVLGRQERDQRARIGECVRSGKAGQVWSFIGSRNDLAPQLRSQPLTRIDLLMLLLNLSPAPSVPGSG